MRPARPRRRRGDALARVVAVGRVSL
jgi:hypothetical protein